MAIGRALDMAEAILPEGRGQVLTPGRCVQGRRNGAMDGMKPPTMLQPPGSVRRGPRPDEVLRRSGRGRRPRPRRRGPARWSGLIGANGAGKTTTVECLQGLRRPTPARSGCSGSTRSGTPIACGRRSAASCRAPGLPDRLRVVGGGRAVRRPACHDADELLEQFGLAHRRRSPFGGMSGGERQRLFLVLALLNRPRLVILDELTQGLDPAARREVWSAVAQLPTPARPCCS